MRAIAMSASAMGGNALVGFCVDKTNLLYWERSFYSIFSSIIFGIPDARLSSCEIFQRFHTFDALDKVWFWHTKCHKMSTPQEEASCLTPPCPMPRARFAEFSTR